MIIDMHTHAFPDDFLDIQKIYGSGNEKTQILIPRWADYIKKARLMNLIENIEMAAIDKAILLATPVESWMDVA